MARIIAFALWGCWCVWAAGLGSPLSNASVKLPIEDASDYVFVPISAEKATSHSWVGQILADNLGFLWFATRDGLYRYDGYQVRPYSPANNDVDGAIFQECCAGVSLIPGMARYALFRDRSDKIWIGADQSLYQYNSETERFHQVPLPPENLQGLVRNVNQDRSGIIWLATSRGLTRYDPATGETARFLHKENDPMTLGNNFVRATLETKDGAFWVATNSSVEIFDRQSGKVTHRFPLRNPLQNSTTIGNPYVRLIEDHTGILWIASARDGLAFVDRGRTRLRFVSLARGSDREPGVWAILEDRFGTIWVGAETGLFRLDRERTRLVRYSNAPADLNSLPADWVLSLFEDREDGIWVGMANAGVVRLSENPVPFHRYSRRQGTSAPSSADYVFSAMEDSHGAIWTGTQSAINQIDPNGSRYTIHSIGENTEVAAIAEDRSGQFWVGTVDGSLFRLNPTTGQSLVYRHDEANSPGCGNNEVKALFVDHLGNLWAGAGDNLCSFDPATNRFRAYKPGVQSSVEIDAIAEDAAGMLWIGCRRAGLHRFDPVTGKFTVFRHSAAAGSLSSDVVTSVLVDRSGTIWVGTFDGLNRMDAATGVFTVYTDRDGLPSNFINGVVDDASGDLWVATSYGLSHFHPREKSFYNYYRSDGVFDNLTGAWKGRSGLLLFGSYSGLTVLSSHAVEERLFIPRVVLTKFQISDKTVSFGKDSPLTESISVTKALILPYDQNTLSFEFAALNYADTERTRYRYRLEGLEKGWTEIAGTQHFARYSTLGPHKYIFQVQARTNRGGWMEKGAELRVEILPPWWASVPFRIGCAVFIMILLGCVHYYRLRHIAGQLNLRFEERLAERTRIAQELHDTLLQGFLSASMQLDVAVHAVPADSPAQPRFRRILELMRRVVDEGRDAVRGLRSSHQDAPSLEQAFAQIVQDLPNLPETEFRVIVGGAARPLHPLINDEVYRIGREAIINSFRHSKAKHIEVELDYEASQFRVLVRDDGSGIDPQVLKAGRDGHWGLPGMRERAERIGGQFRVYSRLTQGTEVELAVPSHSAFQFASNRRLPFWFSWRKRKSVVRVGGQLPLTQRDVSGRQSVRRSDED
jgi:ligand-binding sensor domain-containing protein/signal transduction histidine kinase